MMTGDPDDLSDRLERAALASERAIIEPHLRYAKLMREAAEALRASHRGNVALARLFGEKLGVAIGTLHAIAAGDVPPEKHGHYLAHRSAVEAARATVKRLLTDCPDCPKYAGKCPTCHRPRPRPGEAAVGSSQLTERTK